MKSRYSVNAPTTAYVPICPPGVANAMAFRRWASYAARPENTMTPMN